MPTPAQPFISLQGIALRLYGRVLFEDTDWEILDDQHWAVVGPNGSGKSTLVRALCGQVPVVRGRIVYHFDGALPHQQIALVSFQSQERVLGGQGGFYQARWNSGTQEESLSVAQYLSERSVWQTNPFQVIHESADPARSTIHQDRVVQQLDMRDLLEKDLVQLSDGERRKVSLARALLKEPRLLILDNPFTGLDAGFRERLLKTIEAMMQEQVRVMVVTPHKDELPPGITHVLRAEEHRVAAQGPKTEIMQHAAESPQALARIPHLRRHTEKDDIPRHHRDGAPTPHSSDTTLVDVRGANVSYGHTRVLRDVLWTIRKGEHWALLGPNGSGKTTLLSLILGDHPQAYANDISLFGRRRGSGESIWQVKAHIGWVAPELHLYYPRQFSCLAVVCSGYYDSVGLYHACSQEQRRRAVAWMRRLGAAGHAGTLFSSLSEGEQRIVLLARALVKEPELLILDEPCQGLDADNRARVLRMVEDVSRHLDTSVIYVTHDTDQLPRIITHVLRLKRGQVAYAGERPGQS